MKNKLFRISVTLIILFSFFGMFVFGTILHELSHQYDFGPIAYNDSICFLEFGSDRSGHYAFQVKPSDRDEFYRIDAYTEIKAYSIDLLLIIIFQLCLVIIGWRYYKVTQENKILKEIYGEDN